jgi:hypothetical protein
VSKEIDALATQRYGDPMLDNNLSVAQGKRGIMVINAATPEWRHMMMMLNIMNTCKTRITSIRKCTMSKFSFHRMMELNLER